MQDRLVQQLVSALESHLTTRQPVRLPDGCEVIWNAFLALSRTRAGGNAISFAEVQAYCDLMRVPLEPHHVRAIMAMDAAWLGFSAKPLPLPQMSAAAFDAVVKK